MKLSEELIWRGFKAETTIHDFAALDERTSKKFYLGADPSADSLTIGNLAALMMCALYIVSMLPCLRVYLPNGWAALLRRFHWLSNADFITISENLQSLMKLFQSRVN